MKLNDVYIKVDNQAIEPTLIIGIDFEFQYLLEIPVSITGRLLINDDKVVSYLNEYKYNSRNSFELKLLTKERKEELQPTNYHIQLSAPLSQKAIDFIEEQREMNEKKSVNFSIKLLIKHLTSPASFDNLAVNSLVKLDIEEYYKKTPINQSDWIQDFSKQLGIGNFLLLELQIPENKKVSQFWKGFYSKLIKNLKDMENSIRHGDWHKTMFFARMFYDNIKIGDNKPAHKKYKDEFDKLLKKDQHNNEGIQNFHDAIWKFFDFISKYVHEEDRQGNHKPIPVTTKEDAYFAYSLALGLLNLVGKKISI